MQKFASVLNVRVRERSRSARDPGRGQQHGPEGVQAGASGALFPSNRLSIR